MEVKLENLSKVFPGKKNRPATTAVSNMNLVIPDGKLVGLLGPSGCGKSTTLYMIAGLHKATEGKIYFGDDDVTGVPPEKRGIGLVFQNYALYPHLSVKQNIMFPLENIRPKLPKAEMAAIASEMANLVDIGQLLDRKPKELSGGQQQRVAIARALAKKPQVLLLDEPLSNLDARLRLQTREEIKRIQRETGITTIFVTHDQEEAMSISDEIVVMCKGVVQQIGVPQDVYDEPANLFVAKFLGSPAINVFDGELRAGKLHIDGKVMDEGYEAKGLLDIRCGEAYDAMVNLGYKGTLDEYVEMIENFVEPGTAVEEPVGEEKPVGEEVAEEKPVAKKPRKRSTKKVDVDDVEMVRRLNLSGVKITVEEYREAMDDVKSDLKLDRQVKVGIRPEMFVIDEKGPITVEVAYVEHIGRDISIIGHVTHQESKVRIIISSDMRSKVKEGTMGFSTKRFYVFENNGTRIK